MSTNTYSTFANERYGRTAAQIEASYASDASTYIAAKTLAIANKKVVLKKFGLPAELPKGSSRTFQFSRYNRLALPTSTLTEGTTPTSTSMSISAVLAVMDQWGAVVTITDQAAFSTKHGPVPKAIELCGIQAAETVDREIFEVLMGGTSIMYPGSTATSRATLTSTDYITSAVIAKAVAALGSGSQGAMPYDGTFYIGVCDTYVAQDIRADTTFVNAASYSAIRKLETNEIGEWMGVRWVVSNVIPTLTRLDASSNVAVDPSTLAAATTGTIDQTVYWAIEAVDANTGYVVEVTAEQSITPSSEGVIWTMPATSGYTYNLYVGTTSGSLYLDSSFNAASAEVTISAASGIASSGASPYAAPATTIFVHFSFILGQEAYAVPELLKLETYYVPAKASDSDPLAQRTKVGWKTDFKAVICNNDYFERIESVSAYYS